MQQAGNINEEWAGHKSNTRAAGVPRPSGYTLSMIRWLLAGRELFECCLVLSECRSMQRDGGC
eukprot:1887827-Lingulodinium_polyedra.AAC.1